jgi:hypothetical protein
MFRVILYWALYILQYSNRIKETGNLGGKSCRMKKLHDITCYADRFYNTGIKFSLLSYYIPISSEIAQNIIYSVNLRVPWNAGGFLRGCTIDSSSRRAQLRK